MHLRYIIYRITIATKPFPTNVDLIIYNICLEIRARNKEGSKIQSRLTTESSGPCLNFPWNENENGFGLSPGPLINPLKHTMENKSLQKNTILKNIQESIKYLRHSNN